MSGIWRNRWWLGVAILLALSARGMAIVQDRPGFSGIWSSSDHHQELRIEQDALRFSVMKTVGNQRQKLMYQLDGSESRNETHTLNGEKWTQLSRAKWVGAAVVVTTTTTRESTGRSWESMKIYFLSPDGNLTEATLDYPLTSNQAMVLRTVLHTKKSPR